MPLRRARDSTGALLHEIVHIYAPNNNRFLAEGLAVYLHAKLAGNPAFPNFGMILCKSGSAAASGTISSSRQALVQAELTPSRLACIRSTSDHAA